MVVLRAGDRIRLNVNTLKTLQEALRFSEDHVVVDRVERVDDDTDDGEVHLTIRRGEHVPILGREDADGSAPGDAQ